MTNKKIILLLVFLTHFHPQINAQTNIADIKKYLVFTFEVTHTQSKVKEYYYWISPLDSIEKKTAFEVFPLYTEEYSKDILERCKEGKPIDIFTSSTATNFNFDDSYKLGIKTLLSLVSVNRVKVQSFNKKWEGNEQKEEDIKVYITPITGEFCHCLQSHGKATYGFIGLAYLPVASFSYDKDFWGSKDEKIVKYVDYSYVAYSSHYPSNIHGNSNVRVKGSIEIF